ncbi:MAG: TfoX/Sxy family protein [Clostridia bacterium]|nr:TfoX/Sxy family protein [Clostridia bacterium]MBQ6468275.1 TfoX/Sxy family protein [Clostridia bacterium]MBR5772881.1 TfoX/Sxy family protein [Clostridia bacterium]
MASDKEYLDYILEQLSETEGITCRAMMGEYIIYCRGKVIGGIYDNRFLVKPVKSAAALMPEAEKELPYEGAKEMLLVENIENKDFLRELIEAIYNELPEPKKKAKKQ